MTKPRLFVRWKTRGHWSLWHVCHPKRAGETLCGKTVAGTQEITDIWVCECAACIITYQEMSKQGRHMGQMAAVSRDRRVGVGDTRLGLADTTGGATD